MSSDFYLISEKNLTKRVILTNLYCYFPCDHPDIMTFTKYSTYPFCRVISMLTFWLNVLSFHCLDWTPIFLKKKKKIVFMAATPLPGVQLMWSYSEDVDWKFKACSKGSNGVHLAYIGEACGFASEHVHVYTHTRLIKHVNTVQVCMWDFCVKAAVWKL